MRKFLIGLVSAVALTAAAAVDDTFPSENRRFSGVAQEIGLAEGGSWQLTTLHGRVLATGSAAEPGSVQVLMEDLSPGASIRARLTINGRTLAEYKFYSFRQFHGIKAEYSLLPQPLADAFTAMGLADPNLGRKEGEKFEKVAVRFTTVIPADFDELNREEVKIIVVIPRKYELPMAIPQNFSKITLFPADFSGVLSVILDKGAQEVSSDGALGMIKVEFAAQPTLLLMTPDINIEDVNVVLAIKNSIQKELEENEK